ncbi:MAG: tetratricopeptide repeat protein [Rhodospirillales bacterium]|jgi:adenylate cyclase
MRYQFEDFILDTDCFELTRSGEPLNAEPQVIELIVLLIENRGRMVSKEEINEKIWHSRFVSDAALSSRVKSARQILNDNGKTQHTIRTIHKKGFRFVRALVEDEGKNVNLATDLNLVVSSAPIIDEKPTIAILPFQNLSSDPEHEYFSDGITSDIIGHLSKHHWMNVTSRNTIFGYKGKSVNHIDLGKELAVSYIVEGSVQRAGDTVRISAHLIDAATGHHKWSERYDRKLSDIFAVQDEITSKISARIEPEIGYAERNKVVMSRPANLQTWDCYHLGIYHLFQFTGPDNIEAQRLLLECQSRDAQFGEGYAWWAYAVILGMVYWNTKPEQALLNDALDACDKALVFDPSNAIFHSLKARVLLARKEYEGALQVNKHALSLNPTLASAHCSMGDSLAYEGRYEEALICFQTAIELSPNDPQLWAFYTYGAIALIFKKDFSRAVEWADKASSIPNYQFWTLAHKVVAYAYLDDTKNMEETQAKLLKKCPEFSCDFAREKLFYIKDFEQIDLYITGLQKAGIS